MTLKRPSCIRCKSSKKRLLLFEVRGMDENDDEWEDVQGIVAVCVDCAKDAISQQTIVTVLVESCEGV